VTPLKRLTRERRIHEVFRISIAIKGIDGLLEAIGGLILLYISPDRIKGVVSTLTQHELSEDPRDFIASHLANYARHLSAGTKVFEALYLVSHGLIKIFLVWGLLRNKLWAYPAAIGFLVVFIGYQLYRYSHTHAIGLLLLTGLDVGIILLTWHEYRYVLKYKHFPAQ
jgi:uncharacterized membrane protein